MKVKVVQSVLKANDAVAIDNRKRLDNAGVLCINLMSAPGSGKTTLLQKTIPMLAPKQCGVLVGDLQTTRDADRLSEVCENVVQINTGRGCHLSATQVAEGLDILPLSEIDILFIENVGNMVCPAGFDLGEHRRVALLSLPEGEDKIAKYPTLYQSVDAALLTKTDLTEVLEYSADLPKEDLAKLNSRTAWIECSSKTGTGLNSLKEWLLGQIPAM